MEAYTEGLSMIFKHKDTSVYLNVAPRYPEQVSHVMYLFKTITLLHFSANTKGHLARIPVRCQ